MASASLYLPLVNWHHYTHSTTTTTLLYSHPYVFAGQQDGHIWVYTCDKERRSLKHKYMLTGHKAAITALCVFNPTDAGTATNPTEDVLLSADETGEIARWDTKDGRCQAVNPDGFFGTPTQLKVFNELSKHHVFCSGQSNEISILNMSNLEVVRVWGGHANWVTCTSFYDAHEKTTRLMTATLDGHLNLWDIEMANLVLYKDKKPIKNQPDVMLKVEENVLVDRVLELVYHPSSSVFLLVTRQQVVVFALVTGGTVNEWVPHFTLSTALASSSSSLDQTGSPEWVGGTWAGGHRLVLWSSDGNVYDYHLISPKGVPLGTMASTDSQLYYSNKLLTTLTFGPSEDNSSSHPGGWVSAVCMETDDNVAILTVCNRPNDASSFTLDGLPAPLQPLEVGSVNVLSRSEEISFKSIWPLQDQQYTSPYGSITTTIPVSSNHLAIGYESGTICVVPLSMALLYLNQLSDHLHNRQDTRLFEKAHHGKVTCLLVPEHHGSSSEQKHLLSGGRDGCVKIWNIINGKFVASFTVHASPVESFVEPAEQKDSRIRGCVVSIAHDHSLALISVDSMACLYIIPGYTYPLVRIQWRPSEDYVLFAYDDDTVFVWQLQAGHLDRVLTGKTSKQVMADDRWSCNRILQSSSRKTNPNINHTVHTKSILSKSQDLYTDRLFAQVFLFNIRRLVFDLKESTARLPPNAYDRSDDRMSTLTETPQPALSSSSTLLPTLSTSSSTIYSPELADPLDTRHDDDMDTPETIESGNNNNNSGSSKSSNKMKILSEGEQHRLKKRELVSAVMFLIISSGNVNPGAFESPWLASPPASPLQHSSISYGIRGVNGYISLSAPALDDKQPWTDSSTLTATRLLSIALLSKAIEGNRAEFADYVKELGDRIGPDYCPPSLSLLSKYWQDSEARAIFSMAMGALENEELHSLVDYWKNYLPASSSLEDTDTQMMTRATIVLGIIGCDQPHVLDEKLRKSTALSLTLLLSDSNIDELIEQDGSSSSHPQQEITNGTTATASSLATTTNAQRTNPSSTTIDTITLTRVLSSMELLSQGFSTWEAYINASNVLRTLFTYANQPLAPSTASRQAIRQGAKNAIFTIAKNNHMSLIIGTLTFDTTHAKKIEHRLGCLKIISSFIRKNPALLYGHVYRVIEAVVKTLDPNIPHMRESVLAAATATLHDLVKMYPSVDFSSSAQKLVVGTLEGATIVYDLQTATRSVVFEGHTGPVSVVKFSPDAKLIATGSLTDCTVRVWYSHLSLLGMFTTSFTRPATGAQKPYKVFSFALPDNCEAHENLQFEWPSNRCVKLCVRDIVMSFNV